jgi:FlaA1/EpsC-like NDP-sugar epimerase
MRWRCDNRHLDFGRVKQMIRRSQNPKQTAQIERRTLIGKSDALEFGSLRYDFHLRPIAEQMIFITGATSGLGRELAQALAKRGATLLLHGRDSKRILETVHNIKEATGNHTIQYYRADLSSLREVGELARQVISSVIRLDALVNNAGVGFGKDDSKREVAKTDMNFVLQ